MPKKLRTLEGVVFWTDESNFRKVQLLLTEKGFVNSIAYDTLSEEDKKELGEKVYDCLVYEENEIGVYRCSFHRRHQTGQNLEFKYWQKRLSAEQLERDPMRDVILEVYEVLKPVKVTNYTHEEFDMR